MGRKSLWIFGIIAPVFFVLSVFLLALLNPGYSHIYHTISELGEIGAVTAQPASIMFVVTGGMLMVFGYDLQQTLHRQDKRVWCGILVILYGFFDFVGSGVFPVDAGGASTTLVATVHVYATLIGELAGLGIPIWFLKDTEEGFGWDELRKFSRVVFFMNLPLVVFLGYSIVGHTPGMRDTPIGLAQRLLVGLLLVWILVSAFQMRDRKRMSE